MTLTRPMTVPESVAEWFRQLQPRPLAEVVPDPAALERLAHDPGRMWYTDDTHMTLGVAESLVERRGFDGSHMAAVFARNFAAEPWRGYGAGPPQVFMLLNQGVPWD